MKQLHLTGIAAPLLLCGGASADVTLMAVQKDVNGFEEFVSLVVNVYAVFHGSDPSTNFLVFAGGLPGGPDGDVLVHGGVFYQNPFNTHAWGDLAPPEEDIPLYPGLAVDSFVTMGLKADPGDDATGVGRLLWFDDRLVVRDTGWSVPPQHAQGRVGYADNGPNTVLIGQLSVAAGAEPDAGIAGTLYVQGVDDGAAFASLQTFESFVPAPGALWVAGAAGFGVRRRRRRRDPDGHPAQRARPS